MAGRALEKLLAKCNRKERSLKSDKIIDIVRGKRENTSEQIAHSFVLPFLLGVRSASKMASFTLNRAKGSTPTQQLLLSSLSISNITGTHCTVQGTDHNLQQP